MSYSFAYPVRNSRDGYKQKQSSYSATHNANQFAKESMTSHNALIDVDALPKLKLNTVFTLRHK